MAAVKHKVLVAKTSAISKPGLPILMNCFIVSLRYMINIKSEMPILKVTPRQNNTVKVSAFNKRINIASGLRTITPKVVIRMPLR